MEQNNYNIDPIYSLIKLALLSFYPDNTKLSISDNYIYIRNPGLYQGLIRWGYGENRYDILSLNKSILQAIKLLNDKEKFNNADSIIYYACCGLNKLVLCYVEDKKIKDSLQELEKKLNKFYNNNSLEVNINIYKKTYSWELSDIRFINYNFKSIQNLNKSNIFNLEKRNELRQIYITIIDDFIEKKNKISQ